MSTEQLVKDNFLDRITSFEIKKDILYFELSPFKILGFIDLELLPLCVVQSYVPWPYTTELSLQQKPVGSEVEAGAQVKQQFNMSCVTEFTDAPIMTIQFM